MKIWISRRVIKWSLLIMCILLTSVLSSGTSFAAGNASLQSLKSNSNVLQRSPASSHASVLAFNDHWSGFVVGSGSGNGFKSVQGNWNTQCIGSAGRASDNQQLSTWIGLGGWFGNGLVQTGTQIDSNGQYEFFWESIPANGGSGSTVYQYDHIPCGHHIHAEVYYHPSACSNGFTTWVVDNSSGNAEYSGCIRNNSDIQSAEWIDERPFCGIDFSLLADFQWTSWSNVLARPNYSGAAWGNPNNFYNWDVEMYVDVTPDNLAQTDQTIVNSNNTFTDRWYNPGNGAGSCNAGPNNPVCLC